LEHVWIGDLKVDGRDNLIGVTTHELAVYLQQAGGRFTRAYQLSGLERAVAVTAADINGDDAANPYDVQGLVAGPMLPISSSSIWATEPDSRRWRSRRRASWKGMQRSRSITTATAWKIFSS
jgi:hypothetical protein